MDRPRPPGICVEKIFGTREDVSRLGEAVTGTHAVEALEK
jgi:hypothetical protein